MKAAYRFPAAPAGHGGRSSDIVSSGALNTATTLRRSPRQRIEQLDDIRDLLRQAHASGPVEQLVALGKIEIGSGKLRQYQPAEQYQNQSSEKTARREAHYRSTSTGTAST